MNKILILTTADEIAEGLKKLLKDYTTKQPVLDFKTEKMTVSEASQYIDVSYPTLCKWIKEEKIPIHGKGRKRFLIKSELVNAYKEFNEL